METITLTKEGLKILCNRTSGTTVEYRNNLIDEMFEMQKSIVDGTYKPKEED